MAIHSTFGGRLGRDPEIMETKGGALLKLSVATDRWDGRAKERVTQWVRVAWFGKRAEGLGRLLAKGSYVIVTGRIYTDSWEDRDGNTRTDLYCDASDIELGPRAEADNKQGYSGRQNGGGGGYGTQPTPNDSDLPY